MKEIFELPVPIKAHGLQVSVKCKQTYFNLVHHVKYGYIQGSIFSDDRVLSRPNP